MFMEKVQKIPFIRDGNIFIEFFEIQKHQCEVAEKDIDSLNDNSLINAINLNGAGQNAGVNQFNLSRQDSVRNQSA